MLKYPYNLEDVLNYLNNNIIKKIIIQLSNAINYFDKMDIIHGNIKPSNILIDNKYNIYLSDYSKYLLDKSINITSFTPPELLFQEELSNKSDIWSIGCIVYYLFTKKYPFLGNSEDEIKINICNCKYNNIPIYSDLFNNIFIREQNNRCNIDFLLNILELNNDNDNTSYLLYIDNSSLRDKNILGCISKNEFLIDQLIYYYHFLYDSKYLFILINLQWISGKEYRIKPNVPLKNTIKSFGDENVLCYFDNYVYSSISKLYKLNFGKVGLLSDRFIIFFSYYMKYIPFLEELFFKGIIKYYRFNIF